MGHETQYLPDSVHCQYCRLSLPVSPFLQYGMYISKINSARETQTTPLRGGKAPTHILASTMAKSQEEEEEEEEEEVMVGDMEQGCRPTAVLAPDQDRHSDRKEPPRERPPRPGRRGLCCFAKRNVPRCPSGSERKEDPLEEEYSPEKVAASETKLLNVLKLLIFLLLVVVTVLVSIGVYNLTKDDEETRFRDHVMLHSHRITDAFHEAILRRLAALNGLATTVTSCALATNQQFPFVTVPDFEVRGSDVRVQSDSFAVQYMPVVNDSVREDWEAYALANRFQIDEAFVSDAAHRKRQDEELGNGMEGNHTYRCLQDAKSEDLMDETILDDGTGYHTKIFSNGAITSLGVEPEGSGPFLPLWQRR